MGKPLSSEAHVRIRKTRRSGAWRILRSRFQRSARGLRLASLGRRTSPNKCPTCRRGLRACHCRHGTVVLLLTPRFAAQVSFFSFRSLGPAVARGPAAPPAPAGAPACRSVCAQLYAAMPYARLQVAITALSSLSLRRRQGGGSA